MIPLLNTERRWECPNCDHTAVTRPLGNVAVGQVTTEFHNCRGMAGLSTPMVPAGTKAKVEAREREDYINGEIVTLDGEGRPVMSVVTTRDDGQDCTVYAPAATVTKE